MTRFAATPTLDRTLARVALAAAALALLCFAAVAIATAVGVQGETWRSPIWVTVFSIAFWGLPLAIFLAVALIVRRALRRGGSRKIGSDGAAG